MHYDVVIVGGGPAGLSAALALGRARRRVLVCDGAPRRNALAQRLYNFVTRDGTPPEEFRRAAREQLGAYGSVELRDWPVVSITGSRGAFSVDFGVELVSARRILLATGMIDEMLPLQGFSELWGHSIYQCPYCHGYEMRDRVWGYLVTPQSAAHMLPFALSLLGWTRDVVVFSDAQNMDAGVAQRLETAGIRLETDAVVRLGRRDGLLDSVELVTGVSVRCEALFAHPPQRQVAVVQNLELSLTDDGYVDVEPMRRETSVPGIFAGGDLTTRMQGALFAAAAGTQAAAMIHMDLAMDLPTSGVDDLGLRQT